jgi:hypothetical protein
MQTSVKKKLWGLLAFSPWILFFTVVPFILPKSAKMHAVTGSIKLNSFDIGYLVIGNLYVLIVLVCFLIYLSRLNNFEKGKKWLWRGLMFFGHVIAIPIFWYFYIWKETN